MTPTESLARPDGATIAYRRSPGQGTGVVFLSGYRSDMTGAKATRLEAFARTHGRPCLCFDHLGHGASSGRIDQGTIGRWREDAIAMFDALTQGPQILVGSSLGGWLALLLALARPERVAGIVAIAPAPDFTQELIWDRMDEAQQAAFRAQGFVEDPSPYSAEPSRFSWRLVEEARDHLVLGGPIAIDRPVRIFHGTADTIVPWQMSLRLVELLTTDDAVLTLVKDGDHRLSGDADLERLIHAVATLTGVISAPGGSPGIADAPPAPA